MDISIIIINYNTYDLSCACVASVTRHTEGVNYEVIVVDNDSAVFNESDFSNRFPDVKLIKSERNLGFAGGNNLGIKHACGQCILLLNSDTVLKDNAILAAFQYMEMQPGVGALSARLIYPDGRHQSAAQRFPSIKYQLIELLRLQKFLSKRRAGKLLLGAFFDHKETIKVDWVWGAFFMFRREILTKLPGGRLDETYFMYYEDMQWCMDIRKQGYEIHFFAGAEVVHLMGGSSGKKNEMMLQNGELFLQRNYSLFQIKWIKRLEKWLRK